MYSDSALSVKDATGRHISLLNDYHQQQQYQSKRQEQPSSTSSFNGKRKYHCIEPGCNKSFTTSGHLARHHRIHSGEKNFHCHHPGCPSRFSRQDNMMQHYRTHLSPKSRRHQQQQPKTKSINTKEQHPQLHCHTLIGSETTTEIHPLIDTKTANTRMDDPHATTRSRRASTMPSSFHPYQPLLLPSSGKTYAKDQNQHQLSSNAPILSPTRARHHYHYTTSAPRPLIQPLSTLVKPLPMEPESAASPTISASRYSQPYQLSRRPQRAHSASSTSSSSSSFLSPRSPSLSPPPPLIDQTDVIYPKNFIQLPPLQQETNMNTHGQHHKDGVSDLVHTVSIFG
ncbi:hypothetical protein BCR42DRAFT_487836 [Absidia repens]|uniref:C2H2-type domain-containing protein n=1 Tax=Absidia repens TaxID=90262 RepID=A0A1X2IU04_9FUNG|nr:hypothetical protein BCR42DRAFT_487836 [Absidia repens]